MNSNAALVYLLADSSCQWLDLMIMDIIGWWFAFLSLIRLRSRAENCCKIISLLWVFLFSASQAMFTFPGPVLSWALSGACWLLSLLELTLQHSLCVHSCDRNCHGCHGILCWLGNWGTTPVLLLHFRFAEVVEFAWCLPTWHLSESFPKLPPLRVSPCFWGADSLRMLHLVVLGCVGAEQHEVQLDP